MSTLSFMISDGRNQLPRQQHIIAIDGEQFFVLMRFIWNRNKSKSILLFFSTRKWPALPVLLLFCLYNIPPWLVYAQRIILVWTKQIILNTKSRQVSRNKDFCCCCGGLRDLGLNQSKRFAICFCVFDGFIWLPWLFSLSSQRCYDWRIWWWWNNHVRSSPPDRNGRLLCVVYNQSPKNYTTIKK